MQVLTGSNLERNKEKIFLVNGIVFTFLLWSKLDFEDDIGEEEQLSWGVILTPLWMSNFIAIFCACRKAKQIIHTYEGLEFSWWTQASKNSIYFAIESTIEEWGSALFKLSLLTVPSSQSWVLRFSPLWLVVVANASLFLMRKPRVGVIVKPRYVFALMLCLKLDQFNHFPWHFQFAPIWFLLCVIFFCVLMFTINVSNRRLSDYKRKAFLTAAYTTMLVATFCAVSLIELAKYLEGVTECFGNTASLMIAAQIVALAGIFLFTNFTQLEFLHQQGQASVEEPISVVLDFIQAPEDVFIQESANLFRKYVSDGSDKNQSGPKMEDFKEIVAENEEECMICCLEGAEHILLECGHGNFCESCCRELVKRNYCPMCRRSITRIGKLAKKTYKRGSATLVLLSEVATVVKVSPFSDPPSPSSRSSRDQVRQAEGVNSNMYEMDDEDDSAAAGSEIIQSFSDHFSTLSETRIQIV